MPESDDDNGGEEDYVELDDRLVQDDREDYLEVDDRLVQDDVSHRQPLLRQDDPHANKLGHGRIFIFQVIKSFTAEFLCCIDFG